MLADKYEVSEKMNESATSLLYRGVARQGGKAVILKMANENQSDEKMTRLKYEYELLKEIGGNGAIRAWELLDEDGKAVLVVEDFTGVSLDQIVFSEWSLEDKIALCIKIVDALACVHDKAVLHKALNPSNIVLNQNTGSLKLIDFRNATKLDRENTIFASQANVEGCLDYMAPEQTGRMNRQLDYRADLYSLGTIFYEVLGEQLPFSKACDSAELLHCLLADEPLSLGELKPELPAVLVRIVMKLLKKNAEERYQNIYRLKADLKKCFRQIRESGSIEDFTIGQNDCSVFFQIPQRPYGRKRELANLVGCYENVCRGGFELMLIAGASGIGKSLLVSELQKNVLRGNGRFIMGKCERHRQNVPYSALLDAVREMIRIVLTESEESILQLRTRLQARLGANGRIITDIMPEAKFLLGEQPPLNELSPREQQSRFQFLFREFITAFADCQKSLVIFLDDIHWADDALLKFMNALTITQEHGFIYLIGAYREEEQEKVLSLRHALNELEQGSSVWKKLVLEPLNEDDVNEIIVDMMRCEAEESRKLAALIRKKSDGVPFFIHELLLQLEKQNLIWLDQDAGKWRWDMAGISAVGISGNMLDLLAKRIRNQTEETRRVLCAAALIGNRFELVLLKELRPAEPMQIVTALWQALREGFIQPLDESYKYMSHSEVNTSFAFYHDSIQQASQNLLSETERIGLHLRIGRLLRSREHPEAEESGLFEAVMHLNLAYGLISEESELQELGLLNYQAGKKAKASGAFRTALQHFQKSIEVMGEAVWQQASIARDIYTQAAASAGSCGEYEAMEEYCDVAFGHCRNDLERMPLYEIKIRASLARNDATTAVELVRVALARLGVNFPRRIAKSYLLACLFATKFVFRTKGGVRSLATLQPICDRKQEAVMRLLDSVATSAFLAEPELFVLIVLKQIRITLSYGVSSCSPFAYCLYGTILIGLMGDIEGGYRVSRMAVEALDQGEVKVAEGRTRMVAQLFATHWKEPLPEVIVEISRTYGIAMAVGDIEYAAWSRLVHGFYLFFSGANLSVVDNDMTAAGKIMKNELCQETQYGYNLTFLQLVRRLRGNHTEMIDDELKSASVVLHEKNVDRNGLYYSHSNKMIGDLFFGQYEAALEAMRLAEPYLESVMSTISQPVFTFYSALIALSTYENLNLHERKTLESKVAQIERWAKVAPQTHGYKHLLLQAESYGRNMQCEKAAAAFDAAIGAALEGGFLQDAALANERAGLFYERLGRSAIARTYLGDAFKFYRTWGAEGKLKSMQIRHALLTTKSIADQKPESEVSLRFAENQSFDWNSIVKISQLLSCEMKQESLIRNMMKIVMENAGAQRALFLAKDSGKLLVEAEAELASSDYRIVLQPPGSGGFSSGIVNYVLRTEEGVAIQSAATDSLFANDKYVLSRRPKSILCLPVLTMNKVSGILYLENNLVHGAFTSERVEIIKVIASQAAISLENINLYRQMEAKVHERTQELERAYQELQRVSMHDALTGVYNRAYFEQEMQRLNLRRQGVTGLIICDLDGLKKVNDEQGHEAGDRILQAAAEVIKSAFRPCDIVARIGGDEFAVIVPDADKKILEQFKIRIYNAVRRSNEEKGSQKLSISVGFALKTCETETMGDVYKEADARMYQEKIAKPRSVRRGM